MKTYFRLLPSPITLTMMHWIHSPSAFFCFGSRYATSALRCKASVDVGAADMLRATFVLRLEGLSEAIASSSLRLPRFFSTAINRSEKKSAYILASHCEGKKKDSENNRKNATGRIQAFSTVQGFSVFAPDNGTIPRGKNRWVWRVWSGYIPPLSPPSVAVRSAIRRSFNSTTARKDLSGRLVS